MTKTNLTLFPCTIWTFPPNLITNIFNLKYQMNSRKGERPKIYPEVTPLPTEVPVGESKLWFVRSNVKEFYAFIWLKLWIISYPEWFELFFRLAKALGAKIELQIDLTFCVFMIAIAEEYSVPRSTVDSKFPLSAASNDELSSRTPPAPAPTPEVTCGISSKINLSTSSGASATDTTG